MTVDAAAGVVRIGTSGWSYPSGDGTWNGLFYPPRGGRARPRGFDELRYYADHFDTVEVNSSFYRTPDPRVTKEWARRTPPGFEFSLKLYQKFTHPEMFKKATGGAVADVTGEDVEMFERALEPIAAAGKLGALLAQFPPSFKSTPASRDYLDWLLRAFGRYRVAVELRHRTWSDHLADTLNILNAFDAAWVQIDEPKFRLSIRQNYLPNVTGFYYMRLHGRNAAKWWHHATSDERYDYLYSTRELEPIVDIVDASSRLVKKLYLYMNNHFASKAVVNAAVLKHRLGLPVEGEYRQELVDRYPGLREIVSAPTFTLSRTSS